MKDWRTIIKNFYVQNGVSEDPWFGAPATDQSILALEESMGLKVSEEFRSLYRHCDGTRGITDVQPDSYFGFVPIERLPAFIEGVRRSFEDEHPIEALRFFPFFDYGDKGGFNVLGFMYSDEIGLDSELFLFWRGGTDCETVFLLPCEESIESFLLGDESVS